MTANSVEDLRLRQQMALDAAVATWTAKGYVVVSQSTTSTQLRQPKRFSWLWFVIWLILGVGWGGLFYILYHAFIKKERTVFLRADTVGNVQVTKQ